MPGEYAPQQPSISESLTDGEYIKIRELGGRAVGEILEQSPYLQVRAFCDVARHEHELHGDTKFIKKSLGFAFEQAEKIGSGEYLPGHAGAEHQKVYGYLKIAQTAAETGQGKEYTLAAVDTITQEVTTRNYRWEVLTEVIEATNSVDPNSQRVHEILRSAITPDRWIKGGWSYRTRVYGFDDTLAHAALYDLGDERIESLINDVREKTRSQDEADKRAESFTDLAEVISEHMQRPNVEEARFKPLIHSALAEAHTNSLAIEGTSGKVRSLVNIVKIAHKLGLSGSYGRGTLEEGLAVALADEQQSPRETIAQIKELIAATIEMEQTEDNDEYLTKPALDFIRELDVSAREKHQLLNQLIGSWSVPEEFTRENRIAKKSLSYVFTD